MALYSIAISAHGYEDDISTVVFFTHEKINLEEEAVRIFNEKYADMDKDQILETGVKAIFPNTMGYGEIGKIKMSKDDGYWIDADQRLVTVRINTIEEE